MKTLFRKVQLLLIVAIAAMTNSSCTQIEEPSLQTEDKTVVSKFESQLRNYLMLNSQSVKSRNFSKSITMTPYVYGWDGPTMSGTDPNTYNEDGTIDEYGIQNRVNRSSTDTYFRMNWGHSGSYNNNLCQANYWNMSSDRQYNIDRQLVVKK